MKKLANLSIKQKQILFTAVLLITIMSVFGGVIYFVDNAEQEEREKQVSKIKEENIDISSSRLSPEEIWRHNVLQDKKKIKSDLLGIQQAIEEELKVNKENDKRKDQTINELRGDISRLENMIIDISKANETSDLEGSGELVKITFNLDDLPKKDSVYYDDVIAASSFVKAVLLGGIDASTSITSSADPRPILLRLVDNSNLPRKFQNDIRDCHIIASGYGDLSSERVFARVEKVVCTIRETGEVITTEAAGYISGEDGRVGIRGGVVSKEGALLASGLASGIFSGLSKVLTANNEVKNPFSSDNKILSNPSKQEQLKSGLGEGAKSSLDKLSQYYIDRAEQIQPIIQVASGRVVDVVFTETVSFGSKEGHKKAQINSKKNEVKK